MICKNSFFTLLITFALLLPSGRNSVRAWEATEFTQILNNIQLLLVNVKEAEALVNQAMMLEHQITNLLKLELDPLAAINSLSQLEGIVQRGQALSYAMQNVDSIFSQKYPGYAAYSNQEISPQVMQQKYSDWSVQSADSVKNALRAAGIQSESFATEEERLETLKQKSQSAEGRLQALQAGNLIAAEQVSSLQRLRQLMMTNVQIQGNYIASQQDKEDITQAKWNQLNGERETIIGDEENMLSDFN